MADTSQYKVGIVLSAESKGAAGQRPMKVCSVDVGSDDGKPISVVTSAANVRVGSRVVVAPVGSTIVDDAGDEMLIKKTTVGGHISEGMFCDASMLGWGTGSSSGIAARVPESCGVGTPPPTTKPGAHPPPPVPSSEEGGQQTAAISGGLFERKLTKEEKKKLAEEKRKAKKAARGGAKEGGEKDGE
jgi:tRNA-binding EMAP/Myf-like protein